MALIALTPADTIDYVSDRDPSKKIVKVPVDPDDPSKGVKTTVEIEPGATVFKLRSLDVFLMGYIYDNASNLTGKQGTDEVGIHTRVNQTNVDCVRHGLAGLDNFTDPKGGQIVFKSQKAMVNGRKYDVVADEVMNVLGIRLIQELAEQIKTISEVKVAEEKK